MKMSNRLIAERRGKNMKLSSTFASAHAVTLLAAVSVFVGGCAHYPATPRLEQAGAPGYRVGEVVRPDQSDDLLVVLAISGGGTRARRWATGPRGTAAHRGDGERREAPPHRRG
jgi:hypothetical protein